MLKKVKHVSKHEQSDPLTWVSVMMKTNTHVRRMFLEEKIKAKVKNITQSVSCKQPSQTTDPLAWFYFDLLRITVLPYSFMHFQFYRQIESRSPDIIARLAAVHWLLYLICVSEKVKRVPEVYCSYSALLSLFRG